VSRERDEILGRNETLEREASNGDELRREQHDRHASLISQLSRALTSSGVLDGVGEIDETNVVNHVKHVAHSLRDKNAVSAWVDPMTDIRRLPFIICQYDVH
jgi:hypothetical protein